MRYRQALPQLQGTGMTLTYAEEAIGIVRAAASVGIPVAVSFTVETDGRLPSSQSLGEALHPRNHDGDPADFARGYVALGERLPHLTVLGGCCGTDHRHVASVAEALLTPA